MGISDKESTEIGRTETDTEMETLSLEETLAHLEEIVNVLGDGECSLEQSFALYEQGMRLLRAGNDKIDRVEKKMLTVSEEGEINEFYGGAEETR